MFAQDFDSNTDNEHVMNKSMYAGSHSKVENTDYLIRDGKYVQHTYEMPPSMYKCIDEAVVNACDHVIRTSEAITTNSIDPRRKVTWIRMNFDNVTGKFSIENNGIGIPIAKDPKKGLWIPQLAFGQMRAGSNLKNTDSIIGGTNGVGVKIANILSTEFSVETIRLDKLFNRAEKKDLPKNQRYQQTWTNNMNTEGQPVITPVAITKSSQANMEFTKIAFTLDYINHFKYQQHELPELFSLLDSVIMTRAYLCAAYVGDLGVSVYYNNVLVPIKSMLDIARFMFPTTKIMSTIIKPDPALSTSTKQYPLECVVVLVENDAKSLKKLAHITQVNGVITKEGKHIEYIMTQIINGVKTELERLIGAKFAFEPNYVYKNVFLFLKCKLPGIDWKAQVKEEVILPNAKIMHQYTPDQKLIVDLSEQLKYIILAKRKKRNDNFKSEKYTKANAAGTKESLKCSLILPEGDSAKAMVSSGVNYRPSRNAPQLLGHEYYGILTLGGVIMNVRRCIKKFELPQMDGTTITRYYENDQLSENIFWRTFLKETGLNIDYRYDPKSPTYKKEMSELKYGCIIGFVDQDHDGVGFIFPLILNIFDLLWPNLLQSGFVKRFATPSRRAIPKTPGKILEFYSDHEFDSWFEKTGWDLEELKKHYDIKYIKGLATHTEQETIHMFKHFSDNLFTYTNEAAKKDMLAHENYPEVIDEFAELDDEEREEELIPDFETYFGEDTGARKEVLCTPLEPIPADVDLEQRTTKIVRTTDHLGYYAKHHALENIMQKLWNQYDGMNRGGRQILCGAIKKFSASNKPIRVAQLAGSISETMHYTHGAQSLEASITCKAFLSVGGVQLPQFLPFGAFGTRDDPKETAGQPRYIYTCLNKKLTNLIYPDCEYDLLNYRMEEGEPVEPTQYMPIIPMAILESTEIPAHGWKIKIYARDVFSVIANVRRLIIGGDNLSLLSMPPYTHGHSGTIKNIQGKEYTCGNYSYQAATNTVIITELPLRVWTTPYFEQVLKREVNNYVLIDSDSSQNQSSDSEIHIKFKLVPDPFDLPEQTFYESKKNVKKSFVINKKPEGKTKQLENKEKEPTKPATADYICENFSTAFFDGIEEYFKLRKVLSKNLNFTAEDGHVVEFQSYDQVLRAWYQPRKQLYTHRCDREIMLRLLKLRHDRMVIYYISKYEDMKINKNMRESEIIAILESINIPKISKSKLTNPSQLKNNELVHVIENISDLSLVTPVDRTDISDLFASYFNIANDDNTHHFIKHEYSYLLNTNDFDKLHENYQKRIVKYHNDCNSLLEYISYASQGRFRGAQIWLDELKALEEVIKIGRATKWTYGKEKKYSYS